ncbi:EGF-like domain protein [Oesophagostomum dentatum]|uniref:EGF-like domain protein n=1 Tax=Oesophagostomum dentatum TaxID=61180 RepID=A0A0B1S9Q8_OESDE|nr:EGF-like domain protein [Oesophagostomum dentatum]
MAQARRTPPRQHDFVDDNEMAVEETCRQANPCENGGSCTVVDGKVRCECPEGFTGENCAEVDMCVNNACAKNSTCRNGPSGTYVCECKENTVGTYCEFTCPEDQCFGNGVCIMRDDGRIGCNCNPGMTGRRCEKEINECDQKHCQYAVECIDKFDDYECVCEEGWFGKDCDRPCQDVYGSCRTWKREGQCEIPRESTEFFEVNCPVSCEKCIPRNDTNTQFVDRLPAILLPLSWILGVWEAEVKGTV